MVESLTEGSSTKAGKYWLALLVVVLLLLGLSACVRATPKSVPAATPLATPAATLEADAALTPRRPQGTLLAGARTVCASDSSATSGCDYRADGTDDNVEIQQAIDAGPGAVILSDGVFTLGDSVHPKDRVWIKGQGGVVHYERAEELGLRKAATTINIGALSGKSAFILDQTSLVAGGISDLLIDGGGTTGGTSHGIDFQKCVQGYVLQNLTIVRFPDNGINIVAQGQCEGFTYTISNVFINNTLAEWNSGSGIYMRDGLVGATNQYLFNIQMSKINSFRNAQYGLYTDFVGASPTGRESFLSDSRFYYNGYTGIYINNLDYWMSNLFVHDNGTAGGNVYDQITITGDSNRISLANVEIVNEMTTGTRYGLYITGGAIQVFTSNVILGSAAGGINSWQTPYRNDSTGQYIFLDGAWSPQLKRWADNRMATAQLNSPSISLPTNSGWAETVVSGDPATSIQSIPRIAVRTGNTTETNNDQVLLYTSVFGLNRFDSNTFRIDWDKPLWVFADIDREVFGGGGNNNITAWVQLKEAVTLGQLAEKGVGIEIRNTSLYGESFGTARGVVNLYVNTTNSAVYEIAIHLDPGEPSNFTDNRVHYYINGVLKGTQTIPINIPSGPPAADGRFVVAIQDGNSDEDGLLGVGNIRLFQQQ